jgi:hypothetical protein
VLILADSLGQLMDRIGNGSEGIESIELVDAHYIYDARDLYR